MPVVGAELEGVDEDKIEGRVRAAVHQDQSGVFGKNGQEGQALVIGADLEAALDHIGVICNFSSEIK